MSSDCVSDTDDLIKEQQADVSLGQCWAMAKVNKGGFVVDQGVLTTLIWLKVNRFANCVCLHPDGIVS